MDVCVILFWWILGHWCLLIFFCEFLCQISLFLNELWASNARYFSVHISFISTYCFNFRYNGYFALSFDCKLSVNRWASLPLCTIAVDFLAKFQHSEMYQAASSWICTLSSSTHVDANRGSLFFQRILQKWSSSLPLAFSRRMIQKYVCLYKLYHGLGFRLYKHCKWFWT